jgi:6-phosphofructokinase 1
MSLKRIGILTGGGDCPGLNAVIRAVVKTAVNDYGIEVIGINDGYLGLIENHYTPLSYDAVSGILTHGGTILGASNKANPFSHAIKVGDEIEYVDVSDQALDNAAKSGLEVVVCVGGDGTLTIATKFHKKGMHVVCVPKTIDNDVWGTDVTFGFDSALVTATEAIDKLHTTAQSHHRVMVIEVMGRYAGWLGLFSGIAGGGDIILIPEIPYSLEAVCARISQRTARGRRFSIVVVAEGAKPKGGEMVVERVVKDSPDPVRLGGIGKKLASDIENKMGIESRVVVLGHLLRGGSPSPADRVLATRFGTTAVRLAVEGASGYMTALRGQDIVKVDINEVAGRQRTVPPDSPVVACARSVGTFFGDR